MQASTQSGAVSGACRLATTRATAREDSPLPNLLPEWLELRNDLLCLHWRSPILRSRAASNFAASRKMGNSVVSFVRPDWWTASSFTR